MGRLTSFKRYHIVALACSRDLPREIIEPGLKKVRRTWRWKVRRALARSGRELMRGTTALPPEPSSPKERVRAPREG